MSDFVFQNTLTNEDTSPDFSFGDFTPVVNVTGDVAWHRAQKWNYALGPNSPGTQTIVDMIEQNQEKDFATNQAARVQSEEILARKRIFDNMTTAGVGVADLATMATLPVDSITDTEKDLFQRLYSQKIVNTPTEAFLQNAVPQEPDFKAMDFAERSIYLKEGVQKLLEDYEAKYKAFSFRESVIPNLKNFVPLLEQARLRSSFFAFTGSDLADQYNSLLMMDNPREAMNLIRERTAELWESNPKTAIKWLQGAAFYPTSSRGLDNLFSAIDFSMPLGGALGVYGTARLMRGVAAATAGRRTDVVKLLEAAGNYTDAQRILVTRQAAAQSTEGAVADLRSMTTTLHGGPTALDNGGHHLTREGAQRIIARTKKNTTSFVDSLTDESLKISRLDADSAAFKTAEAEVDRFFNADNPYIVDKILDVRTSKLDDALTSNYNRIYQVGQREPVRREINPQEVYAELTKTRGGKGRLLAAANYNLSPADADAITRLSLQAMKTKDIQEKAVLWDTVRQIAINARASVIDPTPTSSISIPLKAENDNIKVVMGTGELKPFSTEQGARRAATFDYKFYPGSFEVVPRDSGFVIEVTKPLPETAINVREAARIETRAENPKGILQGFLSILPLSKNSKLATSTMDAATIVGYSTKGQQKFIQDLVEPIKDLKQSGNLITKEGRRSRQAWDDFTRFLDAQRMHRDSQGNYGKFSTDFAGFETDWHKAYGRLPTEAEHAAYWSYVQLNDIDWVLRNLQIYTHKSRHGVELYGFPGTKNIPSVEGKRVDRLPFDSEVPFHFLTWSKDTASIARYSSSRMSRGFRPRLEEDIASGRLRVVQLSEYSNDQLKALTGVELPKGNVNYIITDTFDVAPLTYANIPYRPGGHHAYEYPWYIRSPNIDTSERRFNVAYYKGDTNFAGVQTEKDGKDLVKKMNIARDFHIRGNAAEFDRYMAQHLPNVPKRLFIDAVEKTNHPFYLTPNHVSVDSIAKLEDLYKGTNPNFKFVRTSENPHNLYKGDPFIAYTQERNDPIHAFENTGSKTQPVYNLQQSKFVDPVVSATRAANNIQNSRLLDDLKIKAAERYIAEFSEVLGWDVARLRADPIRALTEAPFKPNVPWYERYAAKDARRSTMELVGLRTDGQIGIDQQQQKMAEWLFPSTGGKAPSWIPTWMTSTIKDPTAALRHIGFNFKQGMGNPAAFLNQAQQVVYVTGRLIGNYGPIKGPAEAIKAVSAGQYMSMLRFWEHADDAVRDNMVRKFAENQKFTGFTADEFEESIRGLWQTKFHSVGKEVADYNDWLVADLLPSKISENGDRLLDWGKVFFKRGEELGRYTSWNASYRLWRDANPTAVFDNAAITQVLAKADELNLNMSGISNSIIQRGVPGVITQFFSAHLRQMEHLAGKRLTWQEKLGVVTINSLVYGLPVGVGAPLTFGLWPVRTEMNEKMLEKGISPYDNVVLGALMDGMVSTILEGATGTKYDVGALGLGGLTIFKEFLDAPEKTPELMAGVGGRTLKNIVQSAYPLWDSIWSTGARDLSRQDFTDLLGESTAWSNIEKAYSAYFLGKYFTKIEGTQIDVDPLKGTITALLGLRPQEVSDMYDIMSKKKDLENFRRRVEKNFQLNIRRAFQAHDKDDLEGFSSFIARANREFKRGGFKENERPYMIKRALDEERPLADKIFRDFYLKYGTGPDALDAYRRRIRQKENQ